MDELTSRVVSGGDLSEPEVQAWDALCKSHPHLCTPFLSAHYTRAVAAVRPDVYVCVIERRSVPVGFFSFQFANPLYRGLRAAERVGEEMTDRFGVVAAAGFRLDPLTLLRLADLQHVNFTHLDEWQIAAGLEGQRPEIGYMMHFDSGKAYWNELRCSKRKYVSETERKERQLQTDYGQLRFCWSESDWREPLRSLIERKSEQYVRTGKDDWLAVPWKQRLLEVLADLDAETCGGVLSTLYAGNTWVASHFGLRCCGVLHYWFPVYNNELSRYGPGHLLRRALITSATENGIHTIDHGLGDALHKRVCTNGVQTYYRGAWFRPGIRSFFCRAAYSAQWRWAALRKADA
jgi:CelD/BcsL family acetyltransferase involved in cellulose biosynthesis